MGDLPLVELTLRKYERPYSAGSREIAKKICLGLGLLQPGDSRDVVVDILLALIKAQKEKRPLSLEQVKDKASKIRADASLEAKGLADSNIRRQLKRLRDLFLVEKINNEYRISELEPLEKIFDEKVSKFLVPSILERIKEYLVALKSELEKS